MCNETLFTKRVSKDFVVNENGSSLLDLCEQTGYILLNGRTETDNRIGECTCTCVKRIGSSVVDYVMSCDLKYISDFQILPPTIYSNHSQVKFRCTPLVKYMTRQFNVDKKLWEE